MHVYIFIYIGLVAARHLAHFGYKPLIYYPKRSKNELYQRLLLQCENIGTPIINTENIEQYILQKTDIIVDAIFGFSFHGEVRDPFKKVIELFQKTKKPIVSVDIPSGWDVTTGPSDESSFQPEVLVSLTAPKECAAHFQGKYHYIGGRFVTPALAAKFGFDIPKYNGSEQVVEL